MQISVSPSIANRPHAHHKTHLGRGTEPSDTENGWKNVDYFAWQSVDKTLSDAGFHNVFEKQPKSQMIIFGP